MAGVASLPDGWSGRHALQGVTSTSAGKQPRALTCSGTACAPEGWRRRHSLHPGARKRTAGQRTAASSPSRAVCILNRLRRWRRRHHAGTGAGQHAGATTTMSSRASDRRRRRHGQPDQATQGRLDRSRNCALLAHRQSRRRRDYDDRGWADIHVSNPAYRGLQNGRRSNHGRTGHGHRTS